MNLKKLGWDDYFEEHSKLYEDTTLQPARVMRRNRSDYHVCGSNGPLNAKLSGRFSFETNDGNALPAIGDWVMIQEVLEEDKGIIQTLLPSKSRLSRRAVGSRGRTDEPKEARQQIVAANVDVAFLVSGLDGGRNFNLARIERYLTLAWDSGATPVVVLNKADLCLDPHEFVVAVEEVAFGVPVYVASAALGVGLDKLSCHLSQGSTGVFLGPSGVGKSSLINALQDSHQLRTRESREEDRRGRHTTTWSEIILLPDGGMVIDTPGMRDIQMWANEESVEQTFSDIEELSSRCKFRNCSHTREKGCAILAAIEGDQLDRKRYKNYLKQIREIEYVARQADAKRKMSQKTKEKKMAIWSRQFNKGNSEL